MVKKYLHIILMEKYHRFV